MSTVTTILISTSLSLVIGLVSTIAASTSVNVLAHNLQQSSIKGVATRINFVLEGVELSLVRVIENTLVATYINSDVEPSLTGVTSQNLSTQTSM
jgi:hypothetical protein